eukprot:TRINITY_DN64478_c0_g1_i1.p1 TRINITY_DN64478_c0_g1~~TRINITY_DN64478_c0_g1_i1.p1  ORF type:complete len:718 (+),score=253.75 TRINITY_DN64478_c0_g1_i1:208-2361(+)
MKPKKKQTKTDGSEKSGKTAKKSSEETEHGEDMGDLFGGDGLEEEFSVSEKYAKKFNEKMDKKEAARAARILADEDIASDSSDETTEDEGAELLTGKVESKIFQTLAKIKKKDPSIYDDKKVFFDDDDFEESKASKEKTGKEPKKVTYKEFLRDTLLKEGADAIANEEDEMEETTKKSKKGRLKTPAEEQRELRESILAAAHEDDDDEEGLFTIKQRGENDEEELGGETFEAFSARKDRDRKDGGEEVLAQYWKADEDLDSAEQFLRDYIVNREWLETGSMQKGPDDFGMGSASEDEHLDDVDEFEKDYNFRFEVEEGKQIQGHKRFPENSVRERNDKRKRQRQAKAESKEQEKIRRTEELKRLKNMKKAEIQRRLDQIREVTGNAEVAADLDQDFDPDSHDKEVEKVLGAKYDEQEEELDEEELIKAPKGLEDELDVSKGSAEALKRTHGVGKGKEEEEPEWAEGEEEEGGGWENDEEWEENVAEDAKDQDDEEEENPELWFMCDGCCKGIPGGKWRFDCTVRENFTLCQKCFRIGRHKHKFVRKRVPKTAMPPPDWKPENAGPTEEAKKDLDDYFQLDYEDIIGGDLPTRFKYRKVAPKDFGMPVNVLLSKSPKELNQMYSIKKLRTYRDEGPPEDHPRFRGGKGKGQGKGDGKKSWKNNSSEGNGKKKKKKGQASGSGDGVSAQRLGAYNLEQDKFAKSNSGGKKRKWKEANNS